MVSRWHASTGFFLSCLIAGEITLISVVATQSFTATGIPVFGAIVGYCDVIALIVALGCAMDATRPAGAGADVSQGVWNAWKVFSVATIVLVPLPLATPTLLEGDLATWVQVCLSLVVAFRAFAAVSLSWDITKSKESATMALEVLTLASTISGLMEDYEESVEAVTLIVCVAVLHVFAALRTWADIEVQQGKRAADPIALPAPFAFADAVALPVKTLGAVAGIFLFEKTGSTALVASITSMFVSIAKVSGDLLDRWSWDKESLARLSRNRRNIMKGVSISIDNAHAAAILFATLTVLWLACGAIIAWNVHENV